MTLREIHERCKARHVTTDTSDRIPDPGLCDHCLRMWPCVDYLDAVAALAILDAAPRDIDTDGVSHWKGPERIVLDPEAWPQPKPPPYSADDEGES